MLQCCSSCITIESLIIYNTVKVKYTISALLMQSVKQELYSRRDNLVFTGISDHKEETNDQCKKMLVRVLSETT